MPNKQQLTVESLIKEAKLFAPSQSELVTKDLYGITDGKAVGTFIEHKFREHITERYTCEAGNAAVGIDFPDVNVDIKVTSIKQPQSSCPFRSARQKIYGLGYDLLVFVYEKIDDPKTSTAKLKFMHTIFVDKDSTADFQTTSGIINILENNGNTDDLIAFMFDKNLPIEEIEANALAEELIKNSPRPGYLTISNALQWRLQYKRVIDLAGTVDGVKRL